MKLSIKLSTARRGSLRRAACAEGAASRSVSLFSHAGGDVVHFNFAYRGNDPSVRVHFLTRPPDAGRSRIAYRLPPSLQSGPDSFWRTEFTEVPLLTATMRETLYCPAGESGAETKADTASAEAVPAGFTRPDARGSWKARPRRDEPCGESSPGKAIFRKVSGARNETSCAGNGTVVLIGFEDGADAAAAASTEAAIRSVPGGVDVASFSLEDARMLGGMMRVPLLLLLSGAGGTNFPGDRQNRLAAYFSPHAEPTPRIHA